MEFFHWVAIIVIIERWLRFLCLQYFSFTFLQLIFITDPQKWSMSWDRNSLPTLLYRHVARSAVWLPDQSAASLNIFAVAPSLVAPSSNVRYAVTKHPSRQGWSLISELTHKRSRSPVLTALTELLRKFILNSTSQQCTTVSNVSLFLC